MCRSEDISVESVLCFHFRVGSTDRTQAIRPAQQASLPTELFYQPWFDFLRQGLILQLKLQEAQACLRLIVLFQLSLLSTGIRSMSRHTTLKEISYLYPDKGTVWSKNILKTTTAIRLGPLSALAQETQVVPCPLSPGPSLLSLQSGRLFSFGTGSFCYDASIGWAVMVHAFHPGTGKQAGR